MEKFTTDIADYPEGIVLAIDKPYRWTSADVIRKIKWKACRHFGKKNLKVGHAGTLDPLATGILLVCIGPATRKAEQLQSHEKEYLAGVTFGATTPSYDLEKGIDRSFPTGGVSKEALIAVLPKFIGEQMQVAPLFSAKSVDGVRAYETARKLFKAGNTEVLHDADSVLRASKITISALTLESYTQAGSSQPAIPEDDRSRINVADISGISLPQAEIRVSCSKGTYIRALARDLGEALGSGAFLHSLRRTRVGEYSIENALTMDEAIAALD